VVSAAVGESVAAMVAVDVGRGDGTRVVSTAVGESVA
jgi:hypothetical protein